MQCAASGPGFPPPDCETGATNSHNGYSCHLGSSQFTGLLVDIVTFYLLFSLCSTPYGKSCSFSPYLCSLLHTFLRKLSIIATQSTSDASHCTQS